ncbi:hypothetical protein BC830DRAFT_1079769 [Chytriomyces sp. MP71]|nr:hypothetical protein BC830DRAFT_1079769 [Chytriomyces sp. MP71]
MFASVASIALPLLFLIWTALLTVPPAIPTATVSYQRPGTARRVHLNARVLCAASAPRPIEGLVVVFSTSLEQGDAKGGEGLRGWIVIVDAMEFSELDFRDVAEALRGRGALLVIGNNDQMLRMNGNNLFQVRAMDCHALVPGLKPRENSHVMIVSGPDFVTLSSDAVASRYPSDTSTKSLNNGYTLNYDASRLNVAEGYCLRVSIYPFSLVSTLTLTFTCLFLPFLLAMIYQATTSNEEASPMTMQAPRASSLAVVDTHTKPSSFAPTAPNADLPLLFTNPFCAICRDACVPEDVMSVLVCQHSFHRVCVERWFSTGSHVCPLCRLGVSHDEEREVGGCGEVCKRLVSLWKWVFAVWSGREEVEVVSVVRDVVGGSGMSPRVGRSRFWNAVEVI